MAKRYGKRPSDLVRPGAVEGHERLDLDLGVYFYAMGERALSEAQRLDREGKKG
ncbi:hypothetical protein [uncultured Deinococcus sp.]|uniref:hypothetical protein n=1 Tax=uncultured Deinococcus sp. TaxID=158789 RepID=UPI0025E66261|nr:hypothetical protein [uncultured Deinococcus sp.]